MSQKYAVNQHLVETLLTWVKTGEIAIPEIQRPFVWSAAKVRDLMDSLYQGFPVGYIIAWQNPKVRLKDGSLSAGKRILIDGQQRVTALRAALLGEPVVNDDYRTVRIQIAFQPLTRKFEVFNPALAKDPLWIPDIAPLFRGEVKARQFARAYLERNPGAEEDAVHDALDALTDLTKKQVGVIELAADLDIETVTEIFIRINASGQTLSQADFAMSKIAANDEQGGPQLRKTIDYFCHLAREPQVAKHIEAHDPAFAATDDWRRIQWLARETDDLYDPSYTDLVRVAFTSEFQRGRLAHLVALLSGRNFEMRTFEAPIAEESFARLRHGVEAFVKETHFQRFLVILRSAGFVRPSMLRSQNAVNFAYVLYLKIRQFGWDAARTDRAVRRWLVGAILTRTFSGSAETVFEAHARDLHPDRLQVYLDTAFAQLGSDSFWDVQVVKDLDAASTGNPTYQVFLAAQVHDNDKGFLSDKTTVRDLLTHRADEHHLFPADYLKKQQMSRRQYNQVANLVVMEQALNIQVGNKSPSVYMEGIVQQVRGGTPLLGGLATEAALRANLAAHAIPEAFVEMTADDFPAFLDGRRRLMAQRLQRYYEAL